MAQLNNRLLQASLDEGLRAHSEGRLDAARDAYTRALRLAPDHPDALQLLGTVWLQLGDADRKSTRLNSSHSQQSRMPSSA